ncbi:DUF6495 family protein [Ichthyenterobacterium sp. W332]|uniref:DUF6495 family protein n=1 Tax=Microcosmobacter mediterraneus TaxID=3075607 RepID=A0ABU2YLS1_9FLAO|nr:DUF6495 family protein [Ichthyenterobacterium sp. W332]MDT0559102.1 DUF6495 family protein [Ichthyenterobacterium sp. W332]
MKYARLTKEQFEELHQEFINFLASQSITAKEWANIKQNQPKVAEQELDVFSDLVWQGVLQNVKYLEHISPNQMHLFHCADENMHLIALKLKNNTHNLTTKEGYNWLRENLMSDDIEFYNAKKDYSEDKLQDMFQLIQKGAVITKGELFTYFEDLIS